MYKKVSGSLDFAKRELEIIEYWNKNEVFKKSLEKTMGGKEFSFYDGPPTANGKPHIGHILTRVMKDIIPRYRTMKGYHVLRKAGWDTHGLPVELEVEKTLGMDGKQDIEKYGVVPFIQKCKESVWKYKVEWERMSERVGYWVDMDNPYITYKDEYIESVWWSLKTIFDKGLIYKGHKVVPFCSRCGTALSSHEVAQGYKDIEEQTAIAKFKAEGLDNTYFLAWTTTPWTLPSNTALCMGPDHEYSLIESEGTRYILASALVSKHFTEYKVLETKKGKVFEGQKYEPLFDFLKEKNGKSFTITIDNYVTLTDGTGIVHIAPAFGEDDAKVGRKYGLPFLQMVNEQGKFIKGSGKFEGMFCKDADKHIISDLKEKELLFSVQKHTHNYPFCWRCDTPLLYYARNTWFIEMSKLRERLLENNARINWMPDTIGKGRMANFLENVVDWGLSRDRYWGTPLPIWVCADCGHKIAVGSKEELKRLGGIEGEIELHKPFVDAIKIKCDKCGNHMTRTPEVIDCWYDSGAMPFAQWHYPFENKELFEKTFPSSFISEAVDQTRGWFYTLHAIGTLLFDGPAFSNCIVLGHVNDKDGQKMSKHKGNVVDSWAILNKQGADAVRWYFYTNSLPWIPSRFNDEAISEVQRKYLGTLWNTYSFYILYAEIDKFDPTKYSLKDCKFSMMDKWILSSLNSLIKFVDEGLENYKITECARAIGAFTDDLSNWYVRRCRERYWGSGMGSDKVSAYMTLYTVLLNLIKITAPFTPFVAEEIYKNIVLSVDKNAPLSIHLCDFPNVDESLISKDMEEGMEAVRNITTVGRAARNSSGVKNRQPLSKLLISGSNVAHLDMEMLEIVRDELNVKTIEFIRDAGEYISFEVKPQLKTLGPKFGAKLALIRQILSENGDEVVYMIRKDGVYKINKDGFTAELFEEDILVGTKSREGFAAHNDKGITAVLDTTLTDDLIDEGLLRELISKIQNMRKESGFEVVDHIKLSYSASENIAAVIEKFRSDISYDTLSDEIVSKSNLFNGVETDINGYKVTLLVEKI